MCRLIEEHGERPFHPTELSSHPDLFSERAALFFTPTSAIPQTFIGKGPLDVVLPVPIPSWLEYFNIPGYRSLRFWVDLLQRATGKLRWTPMRGPAKITFINYDSYSRGPDLVVKAVLDSLKEVTTGRRDGKKLFYFGAIVDDGRKEIWTMDVTEVIEPNGMEVRCRVIIELAEPAAPRVGYHRIKDSERKPNR